MEGRMGHAAFHRNKIHYKIPLSAWVFNLSYYSVDADKWSSIAFHEYLE